MNTVLLVTLALVALGLVIQILLLFRQGRVDLASIQQALQPLERSIREELGTNREESNAVARHSREELANAMTGLRDSLGQQISSLTQSIDQRFDRLRETVEQRLQVIQTESSAKLEQIRQDSVRSAQALRDEIRGTLKDFNGLLVASIGEMGNQQKSQLELFSKRLDGLIQATGQQLTTMRDTIERQFAAIQDDTGKKLDQTRAESVAAAQKAREEVTLALKAFNESTVNTLKGFNDSVVSGMTGMVDSQNRQMAAFSEQLAKLVDTNQQKLDALKGAVEQRLKAIQEDNTKQLDQMRATVDEKLQTTLEKRLGESFKLVSERLEQVYKGLGEMQMLATGVGDLKRVLTNVKSRGTWGEVQLGAMLEQILTPDQYGTNVATKGDTGERVEFAIKLPGRGENRDEIVWLPIDAKFPVEDYQRLIEAQDKADPEAAEEATRQLENRIKQCAMDICAKYIAAPKTTDFGVLYLPTEGLYAEVIRRTGLQEYVQRECRVMVAGPTTLWSLLNSLQMGFRTLAIEKRSSEVWKVLGAVKTEFGKFGDLLDGVKKKLEQASNHIDDAARKSRTIERKLRTVQELPAAEAQALIGIPASESAEAEPSNEG